MNKNQQQEQQVHSQKIGFLYIPGTGPFYTIHPFMKFYFVIIFSVLIILIKSLLVVAALMTSFVIILKMNHLSIKDSIKFVKIVIISAASLILLDLLFNSLNVSPDDSLIYLVPPSFALRRIVVYYSVRTMLWIFSFSFLNSLLVFTTHPRDFVTGMIEARIPYSMAFTLMIAFRYIPIMQREASITSAAQRVRGRSLKNTRGFKEKLALLKERIMTMMIVIYRHALFTSISVEKRAFRLYKNRTQMFKIGFKKKDVLFALISTLIFVTLLLYTLELLPVSMVPAIHEIINMIINSR
ncbi:MAG: energy-coupling factor transporter transmembrane component T family protein [Promethearchaeota archaeon]